MKRLIYQLFVFKTGRTELFFLACACASFIFYPNHFAGGLAAFCLPLIFIRKRSGFFAGVFTLGFYLFASYCLLVTGVKSEDGAKYVYTTTGGTLVTVKKMAPGDVVFGGFANKKYSGEPDGRFARGYKVSDGGGYVFSVPVLRGLLSYRQRLSERLFETSGGRLRLTQAIVLGDKKYLRDSVTDKYYLTGLGHLLAISGLHVGLYGMVCWFMFSFLPGKFRLVPAAVLFLLLIPFTGFKIPVLRAALIGIAVAVAKFFDYSTDIKKLLLFFAGLFILVSPSVIADPSFLLSFSAVYGLLHLSLPESRRWLAPFAVGLVASAFIIPAAAAAFGTFNVSSVVSTPFLIPVLSLQVVTFLIYLLFPSVSLAPLIFLENFHLGTIDVFTHLFGFMFTLYRTGVFWALLMGFYLYACTRLRVLWMAFFLLLIPYLPVHIKSGEYFPNMGASKGFVVRDTKTHIFYKGNHGDFLYSFLPYLAELGVRRADTGTIHIYGDKNIFIPIKNVSEDYGSVCVNRVDENCKAVYHTRSNTYKCDDSLVHILYKNRCETGRTYLLYKTGDLTLEDQS